MNSAKQVNALIADWVSCGKSRAEIVVDAAYACLGWPYVFGAAGEECTPAGRKARARDDHPTIVTKCQALRDGAGCAGCQWYPGGARVRMYDCRGFTRWLLGKVGIKLAGAGATSQWNTESNWTEKGLIKDIPLDKVCCVFKRSGNKIEHTGMHIGGGKIIHCSSGVQTGKITDKGWSHYAIPAGLDGSVDPGPDPIDPTRPTLKRGSKGDAVKELQTLLAGMGYDLGPCGIDGDFGRATQAAVKQYQTDVGLNPDGVCGPATWGKLEKGEKPKRYKVLISGCTLYQTEQLKKTYPGAEITEEGAGL